MKNYYINGKENGTIQFIHMTHAAYNSVIILGVPFIFWKYVVSTMLLFYANRF